MLVEGDIRELLEGRYIEPIKVLSKKVDSNEKEIEDEMSISYHSNTKEEMLLHFRRAMEMLIKSELLLTVDTLSNNITIAIRKENFLQFVDDRYYTPLQLSSFMNIFKIETKDYKCISNNLMGEPHIGLVISYILEHFTNTFTRFMNRNPEYYYIYEFFYQNGTEIKKILSYLNAYHYIDCEEWKKLYNVNLEVVRQEVSSIYNKIVELFQKI